MSRYGWVYYRPGWPRFDVRGPDSVSKRIAVAETSPTRQEIARGPQEPEDIHRPNILASRP